MTRDATLPPRRSVGDSHALMNSRTKPTSASSWLQPRRLGSLANRIVSQENIPGILPRGFVSRAFAERRRKTSAVLFGWGGFEQAGNSENCGLAYLLGPARGNHRGKGGERWHENCKCATNELSPAFIARSRVRGTSEQNREKRPPEWPHRYVSRSDEGLPKVLRLLTEDVAVYPLSPVHYLQGATILGISLARLSWLGRSLRCRSRREFSS